MILINLQLCFFYFKDITLDIMHRIQGYGGHLLTLVSSQRINLVKLMKDIDNFG